MGSDATLQQIIQAIQAQKTNPQPWDVPQGPPPGAGAAAPSLPPPASPVANGVAPGAAPMGPNADALMQAQEMMRKRGQLAPLGTEAGPVGLESPGISANDATFMQKLMQMFSNLRR